MSVYHCATPARKVKTWSTHDTIRYDDTRNTVELMYVRSKLSSD